MSLIDIPKHVLHENIFKNLDWNSRINFNLSLHPRLRMGIRLNKTQIEIHEIPSSLPETKKEDVLQTSGNVSYN